ncbi:cysteine--tRNA ligase [Anaerovorax odorimutans]|uniref:cysteine--tRNA ligase n=1 Tax=Anaerovorax odorimutans TaxID=109327 RepID=UPI00041FC609|nr:cysteine--tRNA ligase [Anaerovorax odorimutans]
MKIYNTLTRKKEEFVPIDDKEIKIYVCGPTVYNYFHIGNARPFVVFDTLRKYLEYTGKNVKFVQNFTDVDDKIINKAREEGVSASKISEKYIEEYYKDAQALNVDKASVHPKVTENMDEIIDFVKQLIDKGYAYEIDGDVYYSTRKFNGYGKLSKQNIEDLESGARIEVGEKKHDPLDFALWKAQKSDDEIAWDCPWGKGRPGWHIECSAMSKKYLGETIDIHAGGQDLTFPHHENEIAQSEAASGKPFAKYWMHNGYITIDNEKMSKSKGNFFTVRDILKDYDGEVMRFFLLSGHYRSPINFSRELMEQAKNGLGRMHNAKNNLIHLIDNSVGTMNESEKEHLVQLKDYRKKFIAAMDEDLNTADGISVVFELIKDINTMTQNGASKEFAQQCLSLLSELTGVLGLLQDKDKDDHMDDEILALVQERQEARKAKNFARADEIRDLLKSRGLAIEDTGNGPRVIKL